jgi:uncharacterized membrane protein
VRIGELSLVEGISLSVGIVLLVLLGRYGWWVAFPIFALVVPLMYLGVALFCHFEPDS